MPKAWSNKDERQYEHVKKSEKKQGRSTGRAKEIAARTVNKQRSQEGRTKKQTNTRKSDSDSGQSLQDRTKKELYDRAASLGIDGRSKMSKSDLVKAIRAHQ